MLLGSITNFTKVLCRALQLWTLARKLAVMDEWGGRRVILFLGGPFKMLKVRDCKKIWNWIMRGSALTSKIKIRKFDSVIASSELTSSTYTHSLHENFPVFWLNTGKYGPEKKSMFGHFSHSDWFRVPVLITSWMAVRCNGNGLTNILYNSISGSFYLILLQPTRSVVKRWVLTAVIQLRPNEEKIYLGTPF